MSKLYKKLKDLWFSSHHNLHFEYGFLIGLIFTIFAGIGCAFGMEYKDKTIKEIHNIGDGFSWIDFWFTVAGAFIGQLVQLLVIIFIIWII